MKKIMLGAAVLLGSALVAVPADAVVRVDGDRFQAHGLVQVSHGCDNVRVTPTSTPDRTIRRGPGNPPMGQHSLGWRMSEAGFGAGIQAHIESPTALERLSTSVWSPDTDTPVRAVATYHAPDDDGVWQGLATLPSVSRKGWSTVDASKALYRWRHFDADGDEDSSYSVFTLTEHAARWGGDGDGAEVGFLLGCDQDRFFLDRLHVRTGTEKAVYDLGGYRTRSTLRRTGTKRRTTTITFGKKVQLRMRLANRLDRPRAGRVYLQLKPAGSKRWRTTQKVRTGADGRARTKVALSRTTLLRSSYRGSATYEGSRSRSLKIRVRSKVRAGFRDSRIRVGQSFTMSGRVLPQRRARVILQRRTDGRWRSVKRARSERDGDYTIRAVSRRVGTSTWRVKVVAGRGNVAGHSAARTLVTEPRPAPPPPDDGNDDGGDTDPPPTDPPPTDPPLPPPPPGPQRTFGG